MTKPFALVMGLLFLNAGCAHSSLAQTSPEETHMANETGQRPLSADALRALLTEAYATPVLAAGVIVGDARGEVFRSNGIYERIDGRTSREGNYHIEGNSICVQSSGITPRCRQVFALEDGTYSLVDASDDPTMLVTITSLEVGAVDETFTQLSNLEIQIPSSAEILLQIMKNVRLP